MIWKDKIRRARDYAGLTRKEAAYALKVPYRTLQNWELGICTPTEVTQFAVLNRLKDIEWEKTLTNI